MSAKKTTIIYFTTDMMSGGNLVVHQTDGSHRTELKEALAAGHILGMIELDPQNNDAHQTADELMNVAGDVVMMMLLEAFKSGRDSMIEEDGVIPNPWGLSVEVAKG